MSGQMARGRRVDALLHLCCSIELSSARVCLGHDCLDSWMAPLRLERFFAFGLLPLEALLLRCSTVPESTGILQRLRRKSGERAVRASAPRRLERRCKLPCRYGRIGFLH